MRCTPAPLDTTPRISLSADTIMNIFSRHPEKWEEHILAAGNANSADARRVAIDALFTIWSERAERYLVARAGLSW